MVAVATICVLAVLAVVVLLVVVHFAYVFSKQEVGLVLPRPDPPCPPPFLFHGVMRCCLCPARLSVSLGRQTPKPLQQATPRPHASRVLSMLSSC